MWFFDIKYLRCHLSYNLNKSKDVRLIVSFSMTAWHPMTLGQSMNHFKTMSTVTRTKKIFKNCVKQIFICHLLLNLRCQLKGCQYCNKSCATPHCSLQSNLINCIDSGPAKGRSQSWGERSGRDVFLIIPQEARWQRNKWIWGPDVFF